MQFNDKHFQRQLYLNEVAEQKQLSISQINIINNNNCFISFKRNKQLMTKTIKQLKYFKFHTREIIFSNNKSHQTIFGLSFWPIRDRANS